MAYFLYKYIRDSRRKKADQKDWEHEVKDSGSSSASPPGANDLRYTDASRAESIDHDGQLQDLAPGQDDFTSAQDGTQPASSAYQLRIFLGLVMPTLLSSLNVTMVAGAITYIASDFDELSQINWIISAFNVTAAAFLPAWGQLASVFGRYPPMQAAALLVILGSALCAGAPTTNFTMLVAGRAVQGMGVSGLIVVVRIVLADKVTLKDNATNNSLFTLVTAVGYGVGPTIAGYLTETSWRWVFIINIPLALLSLLAAHFCLRPILLGAQHTSAADDGDQVQPSSSSSSSFLRRLGTIDVGGQVLFLGGMILFVLALTWAGAYYSWSDVRVVAPLVVGSVLLVAFIGWEALFLPGNLLTRLLPRQKPLIPLQLVCTRNAGILMYINFVTGMALYAVFYFASLYFTIVEDFSSSKSGENLLYYIPGLGVGAAAAMINCNVWPRKSFPPLFIGTIVEAVGIVLIAIAMRSGRLHFVYGMLALTGVGTGIRFMPGTLHGIGYFRRSISTIILLMNLAIYSGGTLAATIMLNIFNNKLSGSGIDLVSGSATTSSLEQIASLSAKEQAYIRHAAREGIYLGFLAISSFMWLGVIAMLFLGNVDIKKNSRGGDVDENGNTKAECLTKGPYLLSLFKKDH